MFLNFGPVHNDSQKKPVNELVVYFCTLGLLNANFLHLYVARILREFGTK